MRIPLRVVVCMAVLVLTHGGASAIGKVTADPNAGGGIAPKTVSTDSRLAQKVTYEAQYRSVQQITDDLSEMTGIRLNAGTSKSDWPVRARKMNIFVKDVKLSDLMNSIAHVMKFKWSRNDDVTPPTYRLVVDRKAAAAADAMMKKAWDKKEQIWQSRRDEWIDAIDKYGAMSDPELESLRETNGVVYRYTRYGAVRALRALFAEVPETKARFASGQSFRISADALSTQTRDLQYAAGDGYWRWLQLSGQVKKPPDGSMGYGDVLKPDERYDVAYVRMDEVGGFTPGMRWGGPGISAGYVHLMKNGQDLEMADLRAINESMSKLSCYGNNCRLDGRQPEMSEVEAYITKARADEKEQEETLYPSEPLTQHKPSPELDRQVKPKIEPPDPKANPAMAANNCIASFQKAIADATGLGVVSDSWIDIEGDKLLDQEAKLSELLDRFSGKSNYNWDRSSTVLEFRHRKWWKNRHNQIPDEWVAAWSENTRKNRMLSLDDLARMSNLDYYQAAESLKPDKVLGTAGIYREILSLLDRHLHVLRLYSTLSPQLRDLLAVQGINGHMLTADQWKQARTIFDRIGASRSDAIFRMEHSDSFDRYTFKEFDNETGEVDREWVVRLPKYTPPPDPKAAKN